MKRIIPSFISTFILLMVNFLVSVSQVQFAIPLFFQGQGASDTSTLWLGVSPYNTNCLDGGGPSIPGEWCETIPSPAPPAGWDFFALFRDHPSCVPGGIFIPEMYVGLFPNDFRGYSGSSQIDTFWIRVTGNNVPNGNFTISWQDVTGNCDSCQLRKKSGSQYNQVGVMTTASSYTEDNSGGSGSFNYLLIKYGAVVTSVYEKNLSIPVEFQLGQNYPNPFNPSTRISYELTKRDMVTLKIFDVLGKEITMLVHEQQTKGRHSVQWNVSDRNGLQVASGVYYYQLSTSNGVAVKKAVYLK